MTDVEMLKKITGESDEELLSLLLTMAEEKVLSLANRSKIIYPLKPAVRDWAIVAYNRLGMQGETSRSEGGISSAFAEIPKEIDEAIKRYRLGRVCGHAYEKKYDEEVSSEEENTEENL
ncbi:MAG: phage head-tail connector protein [Lachnospiraceae bacterium]|nr:phage head-tail connector protein [Lachnospiraceae bacterium]